MLRVVALSFIAIVVVGFGVGMVLPAAFHVEHSIVIGAPASAIHPYVNDLKQWETWAAWDRASDPSLTYTYPGDTVGAGAEHHWEGDKTGHGKLRITKSDPNTGIECELALNGPEFNATAAVQYAPETDGTRVTWVHDGSLPRPFGPYFVRYLEGVLDAHFDKGLEKLKDIVESEATTP